MMIGRRLFYLSFLLLVIGCRENGGPTSTPMLNLPTLVVPKTPVSTAIPAQPAAQPLETIAPVPTAQPSPTSVPASPTPTTQVDSPTATSSVPTPAPTAIPQPTPCQPNQNWAIYMVQVNDTLSALGQSTGVSVEEIQRANCLAGTMIFAGQPLYLPFVPPPPVVAIATALPPIPATPPPPGPGDPTIAVNPESGPPGTTFAFQLDHFKSNEHITVRIVSASTFAIVYQSDLMVDTLGYLLVLYPSPLDAAVGAYAVNIIGTSSAASGQFTIANSP